MKKIEREKTARSAANQWCKCPKCDKTFFVGDDLVQCDKPTYTCRKWYDAYKGALIALETQQRQQGVSLPATVIVFPLGRKDLEMKTDAFQKALSNFNDGDKAIVEIRKETQP